MRPTTIDSGEVKLSGQVRTLARLLPYLWPADRADLRLRVSLAVLLMVAAKGATVVVPLILLLWACFSLLAPMYYGLAG